MTIGEYLKYATSLLDNSLIGTARLDSLVLMEYILTTDRSKLLATLDQELTRDQVNVLNKVLKKRANHLPISYITHNTEFYGRNFFINKHVLEPRPESEAMIDMLKDLVEVDTRLKNIVNEHGRLRTADVGTGSGALGITAMLENNKLSVDLIDVDKEALKVAKRNVVLHTISTSVITADLIQGIECNYDILLCNLPYVPDDFNINLAAGHEPRLAIFGGKDGLDVYRKLFKLVENRQHKPLYILTESLPTQHKALTEIAKASDYKLTASFDFINLYKNLQLN